LIRQKRILRAQNRDITPISSLGSSLMANQFQNRLVSAIREIIAQGKPAKVGGLGVFCMVHREPTERTREDGAVVLTPPANLIEFMPDPFLKSSTNDPVIQKLLEDLLYDSDLLKDAIENFSTDIYKSSRECSVLVHGLGTFHNFNGKLSYKPADDISLEVNAVYEGLKEIEINNSPKFNFTKPRSLQNGPDEDELISVVNPSDVSKEDPATIYKLSLWKPVKSEDDSITVIPDTTSKSIFNPTSKNVVEKDSIENNGVSTYNFGERLGFDDGLANFGTKKAKETNIVESPLQTESSALSDLTSRLDEFESSLTKAKPFDKPLAEIESELDEISILFEPTAKSKKTEIAQISESESLFELEKAFQDSENLNFSTSETNELEPEQLSVTKEESTIDSSNTSTDESKFFENPAASLKNPQDLFEDDLSATSFKINLFGKGQEKELREKQEEERKRKEEEQRRKEEEERQRLIEEERRKAEEELRLEQERLRKEEEAREAERQYIFEEEQQLLQVAARSPYELPQEEDTPDHLGQFNFKRSGKKNINKDYSHLQDNLISPVLPSSNKGTGDKGLGVALSVAAMILFAVMLFLVYSLFPHQEPDFFRANMGTANMENRAALGLDTRTNPIETSANQAQAGNPALTESLSSADDVLLELTRQHRGGLFGLQGEYNPNIAPFYGIVIYSSPLRSEADDLAERLSNRDWRTNVIAHQRSDGSRVWRVMIGQFSTVTDANMEARLLPSDLRREFVVQRVD
jgi:hypothetical protein